METTTTTTTTTLEPGDIDGLSKAVLDMSGLDDEKRCEMGKFALEYYQQNFNRNVLVSQLEVWMGGSK